MNEVRRACARPIRCLNQQVGFAKRIRRWMKMDRSQNAGAGNRDVGEGKQEWIARKDTYRDLFRNGPIVTQSKADCTRFIFASQIAGHNFYGRWQIVRRV